MSDFRTVLDDEVEKAVDDSIKKNHAKKKRFSNFKLSQFFSLPTFMKVTFFWLGIVLAISAWVWSQKEVTLNSLEDRLASKTVLIERSGLETYRLSDVEALQQTSEPEDNFETTDEDIMDAPPVNGAVTEVIEPEILSAPEVEQQEAQSQALAAAPIPDLFESTNDGLIPKARLSDGLTPFNAYKKPFAPSSNKPKMSLMAANVGMSRKLTEQMISKFPSEVSFAFSPYAPDIKLLGDASRSAGHEMWMMIPLENEDYPRNDPGPNTLLVNASIEQNQARLLSTLGRAVGYVGLVSWPGHVFTAKDVETSPSAQQIFGRGLAVIDSSPRSDRDFGKRMAYGNEFPFAKNNFWLDQDMTKTDMARQLMDAVDYAGANGDVVVMFYPFPHILEFVSNWLGSAEANNVELVPASHVAEYKDE